VNLYPKLPPVYGAALRAMKATAGVLAGVAAASPITLQLLRAAPIPGKRLVVHRIPANRLRRFVRARAGGITYDFDLSDLLDRAIYFNAYERRDLRIALRHCPIGAVCLDAGAAMGYYAINLARKAGPSGVVHCFEPNAYNHARLKRNCEINGVARRVRLNQVALSNRRGEATFHQHPGASADGTLESFGAQWSSEDTVPTETIDGYLAEHGIDKVDFAKVDVEGHELRLLEGARSALSGHRLRAMLLEFNGGRLAELGHTLEDLLSALGEYDYAPVEMNLTLLRLLQRRWIDPSQVSVNLLFKPGS
jgi:FkbM family methyltransferase